MPKTPQKKQKPYNKTSAARAKKQSSSKIITGGRKDIFPTFFTKKIAVVFVVVFGLIGVFLLWRTLAATVVVSTIEAENLQPLPSSVTQVLDSTASNGKALRYSTNASVVSNISLPQAVTGLVVTAKGNCSRSNSNITVAVDGTQLISTSVSTSWKNLAVSKQLAPGAHTISLGFNNDGLRKGCNRDLIVDKIVFNGESAPTPVPAPSTGRIHSVNFRSVNDGRSQVDMGRELDQAKAAGFNTIRLDFNWTSLEGNGKGTVVSSYQSNVDYVVNGATSRGMKVIGVVFATPCWASTAPDTLKQSCSSGWWNRGVQYYPPANNQDYVDFAKYVIDRYGGSLVALELWNEPNNDVFWKASNKPAAYASMVKAVYGPIKAHKPSLPLLAGATAGSDRTFLSGIYSAGIKGNYDAISVHPYADSPGMPKLVGFHNDMIAQGDGAPIWVTEVGWPTGTSTYWHVSESEQAANLAQVLKDMYSLPWIKADSLYDMRDDGTNIAESEHNFGLLRNDFSPKPSYSSVKSTLSTLP